MLQVVNGNCCVGDRLRNYNQNLKQKQKRARERERGRGRGEREMERREEIGRERKGKTRRKICKVSTNVM
jgi:hypothetical protein